MKNIKLPRSGDRTYIKPNFLGGIVTYANNDIHNIDVVIIEAIEIFINTASSHGNGFCRELMLIDR